MIAGARAAGVLGLSIVLSILAGACQLIVGLEERKLGPGGGAGGVAGTTGSAGDTGTAGTTGSAGVAGTDGGPGTAGVIGTAGTTGLAGSSGTPGTAGSAGTAGVVGTAGTTGAGGTAGGAGYGGAGGAAGTTGRGGNTGAAGTGGVTCMNCMVQLLQKCQTAASNPTSVALAFQVLNNGSQMIPLSNVTIRYWFTTTNPSDLKPVMDIDYVQAVPKAVITATFTAAYAQIGFTSAAGALSPLDMTGTGDIQVRFHLPDYSAWNPSTADDHSFQACTDTASHVWMKTTVYVSDELVWGTEPPSTGASTATAR